MIGVKFDTINHSGLRHERGMGNITRVVQWNKVA
jgi:hypothetical protein